MHFEWPSRRNQQWIDREFSKLPAGNIATESAHGPWKLEPYQCDCISPILFVLEQLKIWPQVLVYEHYDCEASSNLIRNVGARNDPDSPYFSGRHLVGVHCSDLLRLKGPWPHQNAAAIPKPEKDLNRSEQISSATNALLNNCLLVLNDSFCDSHGNLLWSCVPHCQNAKEMLSPVQIGWCLVEKASEWIWTLDLQRSLNVLLWQPQLLHLSDW